MKQQKREPGSISLDRTEKLKERVLFSINEYEILLSSLKKSFKGKDTDLISNLQEIEKDKQKILLERVKIFNSHITDLKRVGLSISEIKTEVYNELDRLQQIIGEFRDEFNINRDKLSCEISQVKKSLRIMGRAKEYTAQRIDIIT